MFDYRVDTKYSKDLIFYCPEGCDVCGNSGYKGRIGLYEFIEGTDPMKNKIIYRPLV
jgi:type II secretory ATPase GspE/PulE/Tfp pilus assembly ATPase PilB-like protein